MASHPLLEMAQVQGAVLRPEGDITRVATYGDAPAEYAALAGGAALVDGSAHGRLRLTGADRAAFLHNFTTQDIKALQPGHLAWAVVSNWKGTVTDFVEVVADQDALRVITAPGRAAATAAWFNKYIITEDVTLADETATTAQLELLGPQAASLLDSLGVARPDPGHHRESEVAGQAVTVLCHRWIGGIGYRLLMATDHAVAVWQALTGAGAVPAGEDALTWRRVADGFPVYGRELGEDTNPWEARLQGAISMDKGCYLGQEVIARLNAYQKVQRQLVGLDLGAGDLPREGDHVLTPEGEKAGRITGVAVLPGEEQALALALVKRQWSEPGTALRVGETAATVATRPFWA